MSKKHFLIKPRPLEPLLERIKEIGLEVDRKYDGEIQIYDPIENDCIWIDNVHNGMVKGFSSYHPYSGDTVLLLGKDLGLKHVNECNLFEYLDSLVGPISYYANDRDEDMYLDVINELEPLRLEELWMRRLKIESADEQ